MPDPLTPDAPPVSAWLSLFGAAPGKLAANGPQFLVVAPPKTGTTWLAENLRRHPAVFVPAIKELKYFSSRFRSLDLDWYLNQFAAGGGKVKGEASPSYALLPTDRIRLLRALFPDLKLIFLMREPVGRAWSHARHTRQYREANFSAAADRDPTDADWRDNAGHDWIAASGDYLGQLRRWLSVFPREQVFAGFYESIARHPEQLLRDVFAFLGVDPHIDLSGFPVAERILPGVPRSLTPGLRTVFHEQWHARTVELAAFVKDQFELEMPSEWAATLRPPAATPPTEALRTFAHERDDVFLANVLDQEDRFPTALAPVLTDYLGYDFHSFRGRLFAIDRTTGCVDITTMSADQAAGWEARGVCLSAATPADLKERVLKWVAARTAVDAAARAQEQDAALERARSRIDGLETELAETVRAVKALQADAVLVTPRERRAIERVRRVSRRVRSVRAPRWLRAAAARVMSVFG